MSTTERDAPDMATAEKFKVLSDILRASDEDDESIEARLVNDDEADEEGNPKPFVIVSNWEALSVINDKLNAALAPEAWKGWRIVYIAVDKDAGGRTGGPFADMRLSGSTSDTPCAPTEGPSPYLVPEGLFAIDSFATTGFDDEHDVCSGCNTVVRTSPDSYGWQPRFHRHSDGDVSCAKCLDAPDYLDAHTNKNRMLNDGLVNPADHGWTKVDVDFENGLHPGQNDDPRAIMKTLQDIGLDVLFTGERGQFDTRFAPWVRWDEAMGNGTAPESCSLCDENGTNETFEWDTDDKGWVCDSCGGTTMTETRDPAVAAKEALEKGTTKLPYDPGTETAKALRGEHSDYVKMTVTTITPEQFVSGEWTKGEKK